MAEIDSNMRQFLSDRKLTIASLTQKATGQSSESAAERRERLRQLAISKRVSRCFKLERYVQEGFTFSNALLCPHVTHL